MSGLIAGLLTNPFPGLRPFVEGEELLFFGRESQVDRMVDKLAKSRFLVVVGTSGSGKSSLVNCGLKPALNRGVMASAGSQWCMVQMRPGGRPIHAMAEAFAANEEFAGDSRPESMTLTELAELSLSMSSLGLVDLVRTARLKQGTQLLLVVDQFEELFRYSAAARPGEAIEFVNLLLEAQAQTKYPIYIVLTMRSDFLGECSRFDRLPEVINEGQYLIPRLTRDERRRAICGPIEVAGERLSPVLLTRLVNDVGEQPDQLSILQHAVNRTWAFWRKNDAAGEIALDDYENKTVGTMDAALDLHAEEAYGKLCTLQEQKLCEKVFKALTDKGTDARGIRRPMKLETLCAVCGTTQEEVMPVLDIFRDPEQSFLMPPLMEKLDGECVIDISHEVLMRVWKRLQVWTNEEARSANMYRRLADDAERHARGEAALWRDPDLQNALKWQANQEPNAAWGALYRPGADFALAMEFLAAAKKVRDEEKAEIEFQRRFRKLRPYMLLIVGVVLILVTSFVQRRVSGPIAQEITAAETRLSARKKEAEFKAGDLEAGKLLQSLVTQPTYARDDQMRYWFDQLAASADSTAGAADYFNNALTRDPANQDAMLGMAYVRMSQTNFAAAISYLLQAKAAGSNNPALQEALDASRFWFVLQKSEAAVQVNDVQGEKIFQSYAKAVAQGSHLSGDAMAHLGEFLLRSADYPDAALVYDKLSQLKPKDHDVLLNLFLARMASGDVIGGQQVRETIDDLWSAVFVMTTEQTVAELICFLLSASLCLVFYWQFLIQTERLYRWRAYRKIFDEVSAPEKKTVKARPAVPASTPWEAATTGRLLLAGLIDFLVLLVADALCEMALYIAAVYFDSRPGGGPKYLVSLLLALALLAIPLIGCLYATLLAWSRLNGTFGDRICKLRLVDNTGHKPGFARLLARYAVTAFSCVLIVGFLGMLIAPFTRQKRSFADLIAGTRYALREKKAVAAVTGETAQVLSAADADVELAA